MKVERHFSATTEAIISALKACAIYHVIMKYRHADTVLRPPTTHNELTKRKSK